ncbi:MAG: Prolipoprotein diacylglyceryl transferase, partial [uncultured Nocardioidaceae bacterium]
AVRHVPHARPAADTRGVRGARGAGRRRRVRRRGQTARTHRRADRLRCARGTRRRRRLHATRHLGAAPGPAREPLPGRSVAQRQPQHPGWPGGSVARGARRETGRRLPRAHRRPVRAGGGARDGGRTGGLPAHRAAGDPDRVGLWDHPERSRRDPPGRRGRRRAAPVVRLRDHLPRGWVRDDLVLAAAPAAAAGGDLRPLRRGLRPVPIRGRVRPRQRGGVGGHDPPAAVLAGDAPVGPRPRLLAGTPRWLSARVGGVGV